MLHALHKTVNDAQTRRVFEVATHKVEYVEELSAVRARHLRVRNECMADMEHALRTAAQRSGQKLPIPVAAAACGLHAMIDGLIQNWLLDPEAFDLQVTGKRVFDTYLAGLGLGRGASLKARA